jgi:hypothetical protein
MMATGCIQSMQCNTNTCPTGVTTQDKRLQRGLVVEEKKHRVAHYHANTLHSFLELIGAMGLSNPSDINPAHVMHRVDTERFRPFIEVFEYLEPGQLLQGNVPESFKYHWEKALSDSF